MGSINRDQSHAVMAILATNVDWEAIDFEVSGLQDQVVRNPQEAGRQFTAFLQNGARMGRISQSEILKHLAPISVSGAESFIAADHFQVGTNHGVRIAFLGDNFRQWFLGKTETDVAPSTLNVYKLTESSLDAPIIAELGRDFETTLAHLWELLKKQPNGESGPLLTNGYANILYIRDTEGVLWAVYARWYGVGWLVYASSVEDPRRWGAGNQVFAR